MKTSPTLSANRRVVDLWNLCVDTGAEVTYRPAIGQPIATRTASKAHMVGITPTVWLMGAGRVPLERVSPQ